MAEDGWTARRPWRRGRVVGHAPGMAGAGRRPRRRGTALACGWRWDPALVFLGARPRARPLSSGPRGGARVPVPRPPPCVLAGPSPPPPASSSPSSRACDRPRSRPLPGPEPASPRLTWVSSPGLCRAGGVPGRSSALGSPERGGRGGEPGAREGRGGGGRRCAAGECSPRAGCGSGGGGGGGREPREGGGASPSSSRVVPRDRPCAGRASGGEIPRWAPAADSRPLRRVALGRSPRGGARPPHLRHRLRGVGPARPHPAGAPLRPSVRLGPLAVCCSPGPCAPVCLASRARRGPDPSPVSPPPPPPPSSRAGRGGAPAPMRSPERGTGPRSRPPPRAGRRVLAARPPPPRSGVGGRTDAEGARRPSPSWWPGPGGVEEGERRVARRPPPPAAPPRPSPSCLPRGGGGAPRPSRTRGRVARSGILAAGGTGAVGSPGPASALPDPPPPASGLPHLTGGGRVSVPARASSPRPHRHARLLVVVLASPYLVDPASSICLSQRLSHACLSTHGRYSETANGSLNQLWFLWSLAPLLLG